AGTSTLLLLGGVSIYVVPQNRCLVALDGTPFLTLDSLRTGLLVTCSAALPEDGEGPIPWRERGVAAWISQNAIFTQAQGIRSSRPDPHTIVLRRGDDELLRVRHVAPGHVEIEGGLWAEDPQPADPCTCGMASAGPEDPSRSARWTSPHRAKARSISRVTGPSE
ncbi:MAG TPA: hypothetical protein VL857_01165, partial [Candidatus Eisenbacteria bacterium]|nr:hypothetical protein [Candidatus Eisenbacteria bacterium]